MITLSLIISGVAFCAAALNERFYSLSDAMAGAVACLIPGVNLWIIVRELS